MHFKKDDVLFGYPARDLRDFFRESNLGTRDEVFDDLWVRFGIGKKKANNLLKTLIEQGYVRYNKNHYQFCDSCSKIANAKLGYIKRTTADRLLDGFLKRVGEVNQSDDYALWIDKVYVFGSYLTDVEILGDIDLAILCNQKDNYEEISKKNQAEREHSSYLRYLFYPKIKVILFLRNRSGFISIHDGCDYEYFIVNDKVPNKLLFDRQSMKTHTINQRL